MGYCSLGTLQHADVGECDYALLFCHCKKSMWSLLRIIHIPAWNQLCDPHEGFPVFGCNLCSTLCSEASMSLKQCRARTKTTSSKVETRLANKAVSSALFPFDSCHSVVCRQRKLWWLPSSVATLKKRDMEIWDDTSPGTYYDCVPHTKALVQSQYIQSLGTLKNPKPETLKNDFWASI